MMKGAARYLPLPLAVRLSFIFITLSFVLPIGCERAPFWNERHLIGTWRLVDRGEAGIPPLGERCEFRSDGVMRVYEGAQMRIGTFRIDRNELEVLLPGAPTNVWVIRGRPGSELMLFSRSLNTTVRYVRVGRGELLTGTVSIILKSIIVIVLIFLLYRFLVRVLELE